ncbi:hypothetical protein [Arcobacter sp. FWKO B]|uniref:hypothetical protein n=1 Tax=Arcobacter sp. FWKO B TaxID=2593672 RepID=UPI0018A4F44B|nr:hypothetical protein [Arcobacter sp. FWKO B]QOG11623.1 hypothetical protein FWKOB_02425 [Arcobacter sp. FWKO B]
MKSFDIKNHLMPKHIFLLLMPFVILLGLNMYKTEIKLVIKNLFIDSVSSNIQRLSFSSIDYKNLENIMVKNEELRKLSKPYNTNTIKDIAKSLPLVEIKPNIVPMNLTNYTQETPTQSEQKTYKLSSIIIGSSKIAIINDIIVRENDIVHDAQVLEIHKDKVLIKTSQGDRWLEIFR